MEIEIKVQEDENFKLNPPTEELVVEQPQPQKVVEQPQPQKANEHPQPTLENKKGHSWFDGTSWGLK